MAAGPIAQSGKRTVQVQCSWGKAHLIKLEEHSIHVTRASRAEQKEGCIFYFDWLPDCSIKAFLDRAHHKIVIMRNDRVVATCVGDKSEIANLSYKRTCGVRFADIRTNSISLKLVCDVVCNYFANRYRILCDDGLRFCYWKLTGGWGGGGKIVFSKRVDSELLPILLAIMTATLEPSDD